MSSDEFEYYFEPEDLEPLPKSMWPSKPAKKATRASTAPRPPAATEDEDKVPQDRRSVSAERPARQASSQTSPPGDASVDDDDRAQVKPPATGNCSTRDAPARARVRHLVSVHSLGQFVYCPRSGILAAERDDELDADDPLPRLDYLPNFELERIEEQLSKSIRRLLQVLTVAAIAVPLAIVGFRDANRILFYPAGVISLASALGGMFFAECVLRLTFRRRQALLAEADEPDPSFDRVSPVNWWSMRKAGFESVSYQLPHRHPELPLEGNPWRVLVKGSLRIPVVRSGSQKLGNGANQVFAKHRIRLAAYTMLLEATENANAPYGLIFPADATSGLAIPMTDSLRNETRKLLNDFSLQLQRSQSGESEPKAPAERSRCAGCSYGKPVSITAGEVKRTQKAGKSLTVLQQSNGRQFHCACGDRFGAAPPHADSIKLGLTARLD